MSAALKAIERIISDLSDRQGLGQEWDQIDEDIKAEIKATWQSIIQEEMNKEAA